ncbi:hypothetical protein FB451DRAFT_1402698 [Mycena latifolia]|nr:hypothetical protein FB451DRAFT_1402698 [Mycena latifolia]
MQADAWGDNQVLVRRAMLRAPCTVPCARRVGVDDSEPQCLRTLRAYPSPPPSSSCTTDARPVLSARGHANVEGGLLRVCKRSLLVVNTARAAARAAARACRQSEPPSARALMYASGASRRRDAPTRNSCSVHAAHAAPPANARGGVLVRLPRATSVGMGPDPRPAEPAAACNNSRARRWTFSRCICEPRAGSCICIASANARLTLHVRLCASLATGPRRGRFFRTYIPC